MSNINQKHPQYTAAHQDWELMRDAYKGERRVKERGLRYLPMTSSMIKDGGLNLQSSTAITTSIGYQAYLAYKMRARFPNFVREAVQMAIGMMHSQPAVFDLPRGMEKVRGVRGEPLHEILRRINTEQLITGRVGIMADIPTEAGPDNDTPLISIYKTETIINWDDGDSEETVPQTANLIVLDESENTRVNGFDWETKQKFRVLILGDLDANEVSGTYRQGVFDENGYKDDMMIAPSWKGRTLEKIPFIIVNSCDVTVDVDDPPLLDLGNACMAIYRGEADYRQNLFMQGQDTLVTIGAAFDEDDNVRVGAGARIDVPMGGDAKYIGVTSSGLSEQRQALERLESRAGSMGAQTLDTTSRERESGDSLRIRVAARTADMNQIVDAGAFALENLLKIIAQWMGEDPEKVKVKPNKEFGEMPLTGQTMVEMATARNLGFPISAESMHELARKRRMTAMTYEEEQAAAKKEEAESHPFKKAESGDRAEDQPNSGGEQKSGLQGSDKKKEPDGPAKPTK